MRLLPCEGTRLDHQTPGFPAIPQVKSQIEVTVGVHRSPSVTTISWSRCGSDVVCSGITDFSRLPPSMGRSVPMEAEHGGGRHGDDPPRGS